MWETGRQLVPPDTRQRSDPAHKLGFGDPERENEESVNVKEQNDPSFHKKTAQILAYCNEPGNQSVNTDGCCNKHSGD